MSGLNLQATAISNRGPEGRKDIAENGQVLAGGEEGEVLGASCTEAISVKSTEQTRMSAFCLSGSGIHRKATEAGVGPNRRD